MWERIKGWWQRPQAALTSRRQTGDRGETLAAQFLQRSGYRVLLRNWRNPRDQREELDLVCQQGEALVFVEVKTRAAGAWVSGYHAVDTRKKRALRRAIRGYLQALGPKTQPLTHRFDIIEVELTAGQSPRVLHYENVSLQCRPPPR
jgi:putative endonuclease